MIEKKILLSEEGRKEEGGLRTRGIFKRNIKDNPIVSVITVVFNGGKYLEETIQSVINQTYDNVEYIIIDGGSTDGTIGIIRRYERQIDYWVSEPDNGIYEGMNKGISLCSGEIIGIINSDDWYELDAIKKVCEAYLSKGGDIFFGSLQRIEFNGELIYLKESLVPKVIHEITLNEIHPAVFVKYSLYKEFSFNPKYKIAADYDFFVRAFKYGCRFTKINHKLSNMRGGGASSRFVIEDSFILLKHCEYKESMLLCIRKMAEVFLIKLLRILYKSRKLVLIKTI
jgi:glycosyltransferase involved in cell wall biosynthesis